MFRVASFVDYRLAAIHHFTQSESNEKHQVQSSNCPKRFPTSTFTAFKRESIPHWPLIKNYFVLIYQHIFFFVWIPEIVGTAAIKLAYQCPLVNFYRSCGCSQQRWWKIIWVLITDRLQVALHLTLPNLRASRRQPRLSSRLGRARTTKQPRIVFHRSTKAVCPKPCRPCLQQVQKEHSSFVYFFSNQFIKEQRYVFQQRYPEIHIACYTARIEIFSWNCGQKLSKRF